MSQVSRNVTEVSDGFLRGKRYLIHDRDPLFTIAFSETLASADEARRRVRAGEKANVKERCRISCPSTKVAIRVAQRGDSMSLGSDPSFVERWIEPDFLNGY
jgi:hypothetical protein